MERGNKKIYAGQSFMKKGHPEVVGRTDAQDRSVWILGCKNRLNLARMENKPCFRKMKIFVNSLGRTE